MGFLSFYYNNDFTLLASSTSLTGEIFNIDLSQYRELRIELSYYNNILSSAIIDYDWLYMHQEGSIQLYGSAGKGYYTLSECRFILGMKSFKLCIHYDTNNWATNSLFISIYGKKK